MTARTGKLPKSLAEIEALAARVLPGSPLRHLVPGGYVLAAGSRCFASRRGMTARLVYRQRDMGLSGIHTVTLIVKGIPLVSDD
ncbi:hypothetical protein [Devosia sediminis]|uniref:Uncharacterized protein n=1 Tax=Devosia sediminis TaxID=2798801 RepID=A0A934IWA7_9HYPH|nr:hypothetical protein [Devosia sediminis]MBJ3783395.1 hypothetical protein [Devosia sediminis]